MGFFSELKSDLSQAVNTILPEDEEEQGAGKVDLGQMLDHLDDIKLDESMITDSAEKAVTEDEGSRAADAAAQDTLAQAVQEIQASNTEGAGDQPAQSMPEPSEPEPEFREVEESAEDGWEEMDSTPGGPDEQAEALAATLGVLEEMSRDRVPEQPVDNTERDTVPGAVVEQVSSSYIGGMGIMDITQQTPTDETASITEGMVINGDVTTSGSIDVVGKIIGNVVALGKLNVTGEIVGDSKAAEVYAEAARITGEVNSQGSVKVGQSTVVIGNIFATSAVIAGAVKGDIDVHGPVVLDTTAIVMGNIKSQSVQINNGAVIEGMCSQSYAEVNPSAFFDGLKGNK